MNNNKEMFEYYNYYDFLSKQQISPLKVISKTKQNILMLLECLEFDFE